MIELQSDINIIEHSYKLEIVYMTSVSSVIILDVYHFDDRFRALTLGLEV